MSNQEDESRVNHRWPAWLRVILGATSLTIIGIFVAVVFGIIQTIQGADTTESELLSTLVSLQKTAIVDPENQTALDKIATVESQLAQGDNSGSEVIADTAGESPTNNPLPTNSPTVTPSFVPTSTSTPIPSSTPIPTSTSAPSPTPSPTSTPTLLVIATSIPLDLSEYGIGDFYVGPETKLIVGERGGQKLLTGFDDFGVLEITEFIYSGHFEFVILADWNVPFSQIITLKTVGGGEVTLEFIDQPGTPYDDIMFGNVRRDYRETSWLTEEGINELRIEVDTAKQAAKFWLNGEFFATVFVPSDAVFTSLSISGIQQDDYLFGVTSRVVD